MFKNLMLFIAAQYVYLSSIGEIRKMNRPDVHLALYSTGVSQMKLQCSESLSFVISLQLDSVTVQGVGDEAIRVLKRYVLLAMLIR